MRLNNKSIQGLFLYSPNVEYERGDFVVSGNCMYICTANSSVTVRGIDPQFDTTGVFKVYPGDKISTAQEYYDYINNIYVWKFCSQLSELYSNLGVYTIDIGIIEEVNNRDELSSIDISHIDDPNQNNSVEDRIRWVRDSREYAYVPYREDKYISGNVLNQVLQDSFFGIGEGGVITNHIYANRDEEGNVVPEYSIGGTLLNIEEGKILDAIIKSPDLNNGMFNIDRTVSGLAILQTASSTTDSVLVKQYTYFDTSTENITVRIQEIIDPDSGCVCYRYATGTKREDSEWNEEQEYEIGDIIKIQEQNSNRFVTYIAKQIPPIGVGPYTVDNENGYTGETFWKIFKGDYEYQDSNISDWKFNSSSSESIVEQVNRIKAYYNLKIEELEATKNQLTGSFCNREVPNLNQQGDQTIVTLIAGENVRMHKSWEYINSNEDQVLQALGINDILEACTLLASQNELSYINQAALAINLVVRVGTSNNYTYYCSPNGGAWQQKTTPLEVKQFFGLTASQKTSDIFYISSNLYRNFLETSPDVPITVIIKDQSTGSLSVAKPAEILNQPKAGKTLLTSSNLEDLVSRVYYEDLVYNDNCLGCDETNTAFPELGGYVGLVTDDPDFHIPAPMLMAAGNRVLVKTALNFPIYHGSNLDFSQFSSNVGSSCYAQLDPGDPLGKHKVTTLSSYVRQVGDVVVDEDTKKRYVAIKNASATGTKDDYYFNVDKNWISLTELVDECPWKSYFWGDNEDTKIYMSCSSDRGYHISKYMLTPFGFKNSLWNFLVLGTLGDSGDPGDLSLSNRLPSSSDFDSIRGTCFPKYSYYLNVEAPSKSKVNISNSQSIDWEKLIESNLSYLTDISRFRIGSLICSYKRKNGTSWEDVDKTTLTANDLKEVAAGEDGSIVEGNPLPSVSDFHDGDIIKISPPRDNSTHEIDLPISKIKNNTNGYRSEQGGNIHGVARGVFSIIYSADQGDYKSAYYCYFNLSQRKVYIKSCFPDNLEQDPEQFESSSISIVNGFIKDVFQKILPSGYDHTQTNSVYNWTKLLSIMNGDIDLLPSSNGRLSTVLRNSRIITSNSNSENQSKRIIKVEFKYSDSYGDRTAVSVPSIGDVSFWKFIEHQETMESVERIFGLIHDDDINIISDTDSYSNFLKNNIGVTILDVSKIKSCVINKVYKLFDLHGWEGSSRLNSSVYFSQQNPEFGWKRLDTGTSDNMPIYKDRIDKDKIVNHMFDVWKSGTTYNEQDIVIHKSRVWECIEKNDEEPDREALAWKLRSDLDVPMPGDVFLSKEATYIWSDNFRGPKRVSSSLTPHDSYEFPKMNTNMGNGEIMFLESNNKFFTFEDISNERYQLTGLGGNPKLNFQDIFDYILLAHPITEIEDTRRKSVLKKLGINYSTYKDDLYHHMALLKENILRVEDFYKNRILKSLRSGVDFIVYSNGLYKKINVVNNDETIVDDLGNDNNFIVNETSSILNNLPGTILSRFFSPFLIYKKYDSISNVTEISHSTDFHIYFTNNPLQSPSSAPQINNNWISGFGSLLQLLLDKLSNNDQDTHTILEYINEIEDSSVLVNLPSIPIRTVCKDDAGNDLYYINGNFWVFAGISTTSSRPNSIPSDYLPLTPQEFSNPNDLPEAFGLGKYYCYYKVPTGNKFYWWYVYQNPGWITLRLNTNNQLVLPSPEGVNSSDTYINCSWGDETSESVSPYSKGLNEALYDILRTNYYLDESGNIKGIFYNRDYSYKIGDIVIDDTEHNQQGYIQRMWRCKQASTDNTPSQSSDYWEFYDDPLYHTYTLLPNKTYLLTHCDPSIPIRVITKINLGGYDYFLALNTDASDFRSSCIATILIQTNNYEFGGGTIRKTYVITLDLSEIGDDIQQDYEIIYHVTDNLTLSVKPGEDINSTRILTLSDPDYNIKNIYYRYKI